MRTAIIMPVYEPDEKMVRFADSLVAAGFEDIIIVNDGSSEGTLHCFEEAARHPQVTLLNHEVNGGKGKALKTAFAYLAKERPDIEGGVTVDGDGQHTVDCIRACLATFDEHPEAVVLGGRDFDQPNVPSRSRKGNKISRVVYRYAMGIRLNDTQTGLRVVPAKYFEMFSQIRGDRYEYETNMLITIVNQHIPYYETPIATIYIDDNASSHFNPVKDSIKIYVVVLRYFLKFMVSSLASWVIDIAVYAILVFFLESRTDPNTQVLICTIASRVISSICNFMFNKKGVFKSVDKLGGAAVRYYILAFCQLLLSYGFVHLFTDLVFHVGGMLEVIIKCAVDLCLFVFSYQIQRKWVFKEKKID